MNRQAWKQGLLTVPTIGVSLLPKVVCPLCWPAYTALLSSVGVGFLPSSKYLLPLTAAFLILSIGLLAFRAQQRRGYGPFWLGVAAALVVLFGKFQIESDRVMYGGIAVLVLASAWNAWPRRAVPSMPCPQCAPVRTDFLQPGAKEKST